MTAKEFAEKYNLKMFNENIVETFGPKDAGCALMMEGFKETGASWKKDETIVFRSIDGSIMFPS